MLTQVFENTDVTSYSYNQRASPIQYASYCCFKGTIRPSKWPSRVHVHGSMLNSEMRETAEYLVVNCQVR